MKKELTNQELDAEVRLAMSAQTLLDEPRIWKAFDAMRAGIHENLDAIPLEDFDNLRLYKMQLEAIKQLEQHLNNSVKAGTRASARIDERKARAERDAASKRSD